MGRIAPGTTGVRLLLSASALEGPDRALKCLGLSPKHRRESLMSGLASRIGALCGAALLAGGCLHAQTVTISPGYVNLPLGGTQQYTATVTGLTPATVTWGVTGGGSITPTGLYTAPSTLPKGSVLVSATSTVNKKISTVVYVNPE